MRGTPKSPKLNPCRSVRPEGFPDGVGPILSKFPEFSRPQHLEPSPEPPHSGHLFPLIVKRGHLFLEDETFVHFESQEEP